MASGLTTHYDIPYPLSTDPVNVHGDLLAMVTQIDDVLSGKLDLVASGTFLNPMYFTTLIDAPTNATFGLFATPATLNVGAAATTLNLGAATGTATINNPTITLGNATILNINGASPSITTSSTGTASVFNTNVLTGNLFGAATTMHLGARTTTLTHKYSGGATVSGETKTIHIGTSGLAGSTTSILLGSDVGTTAVSNISLSGKIQRPATSSNVASWTTSGQAFDIAAATFLDTSTAAAGTVATRAVNTFNTPTLASTNAITVTDAATLYVSDRPAAGTNTTITNGWSILVPSGNVKFAGTGNSFGTITSGTWNASVIGPTYGGTNQATYATGDILYSSGNDTLAKRSIGSTGQILTVSGVVPVWTTATFPSTATGTGKVLRADGTNWVASTATFPDSATGTGTFLRADGTNWVASTATLPATAIGTGTFLRADGTNWVASTATLPATATGTGTILRADGTNWSATTATYPTTTTVNQILYSSSANVIGGLSTANNGVLVTSASGVPSISTSLPTGISLATSAGTAGTAPLKMVSGTNLATVEAGAIEYDGSFVYATKETTSGRGAVSINQTFRLTAPVTAFGTAIGDFFGATSSINLAASSVYEIEYYAYFTKTTAGTLTWTLTASSAPTFMSGFYIGSGVTGSIVAAAPTTGYTGSAGSVTAAFAATASLTTAVNHAHHIKATVQTNAATTFKLQATQSAGTITPLANSYYTVKRISSSQGSFA
jgi:hypothetical protein